MHALFERDWIDAAQEMLHADLTDGDDGKRISEGEGYAHEHETVPRDLGRSSGIGSSCGWPHGADDRTDENHEDGENDVTHDGYS